MDMDKFLTDINKFNNLQIPCTSKINFELDEKTKERIKIRFYEILLNKCKEDSYNICFIYNPDKIEINEIKNNIKEYHITLDNLRGVSEYGFYEFLKKYFLKKGMLNIFGILDLKEEITCEFEVYNILHIRCCFLSKNVK